MKKVPNLMANLSKELTNYIKQQKKFEKEIIKAKRGCYGVDKGTTQYVAERLRINKELSAMSQMIRKQENEAKRLKYNLRNILP
jgi:hypothetical protein